MRFRRSGNVFGLIGNSGRLLVGGQNCAQFGELHICPCRDVGSGRIWLHGIAVAVMRPHKASVVNNYILPLGILANGECACAAVTLRHGNSANRINACGHRDLALRCLGGCGCRCSCRCSGRCRSRGRRRLNGSNLFGLFRLFGLCGLYSALLLLLESFYPTTAIVGEH